MTILSTGLKNHMLAVDSLKDALDEGFLYFYSGTPPASADDAPTGTLLAKIAADVTPVDDGIVGLEFAASASSGVLQNLGSQDWAGLYLANGAPTYARFVAPDDLATIGSSSTTAKRAQLTVGTFGADITISSSPGVDGETQPIAAFEFRL